MDPGTKLEKNENNEDGPNSEGIAFLCRKLVGALMYLAGCVCVRSDCPRPIAYAVSYLSQFNYSEIYWAAAKRILRYLQGTRRPWAKISKNRKISENFLDADWVNCPSDRRSYTGYAFVLGGCPISWEAVIRVSSGFEFASLMGSKISRKQLHFHRLKQNV